MRRASPLLLVLALACPAMAADAAIELVGRVTIDSGKTSQVNAPAKGLVVADAGADGRAVEPGEAVIRFDARLIEEDLDDKRRNAAIARLALAQWNSSRDANLEDLQAQRRLLRADLVATRAAIAAAARPDPEVVAQLDAARRSAELRAELARRDTDRVASDRARGLASESALAASRRAAELALRAVAGPTLAWKLAAEPPREPADLVLLRIHERDVAVKLGIGADGQERADLGIGARIAAEQAQLQADLAARRGDLERAEADLREAERDARDRTPLAEIVVAPAAGGEPVRRIRFAPAGCAVPEGWSADRGEAFDAARGWGWDAPLAAGELLARAAPPAPAAGGPPAAAPSGSGPRPGGKRPGGKGGKVGGGGGGGPFSGGLALLDHPATWSLVLPDGSWQVTVGLGDDRDWDGAAVRIGGTALGLPGRIGPGIARNSATVTVAGGRLVVRVGDAAGKSWRAPAAGRVVLQENAVPGFRVDDPSWSLGFLAGDDALVVDALIDQELAPLLAPGRTPKADAPALIDRLAAAGIELVRGDGSRLPAEVVSVGAQSVRWTGGQRDWGESNPADNLAREVRLRPTGPLVHGLAVGERLRVAVRVPLPAGATLLPPHLVRLDRDGAVVSERGGQQAVLAVRLGAAVAVDRALDAARLVPPGERQELAAERAAGRFRGEVIPGQRTRCAIGWLWGRVESLVDDGSVVQAGDVVLTAYNPQLDADRARIERERQAAVRNVLAAAERRRQDQLRLRGEHEARIAAEIDARVRLRRHLDDDPVALQQAEDATANAASAGTAASEQRLRLARLSAPTADAVADAEAGVGRAAIGIDRAALGAAAVELAPDWLQGQVLAGDWGDKVAALARREAELAEAGLQERINTLSDRIAMERAVEGDWWQRHFSQNRLVKAPVAGRILFLTGWNDQTQRSEKIGKEFPLWGGMSFAEIVDESTLGFTAELPEELFPRLKPGTAIELELADAPGKAVPGALRDIGRAFTIPRDRLQGDDDRDSVSSRRVFTVTATFAPPAELRGRITSGAKGWLRLP